MRSISKTLKLRIRSTIILFVIFASLLPYSLYNTGGSYIFDNNKVTYLSNTISDIESLAKSSNDVSKLVDNSDWYINLPGSFLNSFGEVPPIENCTTPSLKEITRYYDKYRITHIFSAFKFNRNSDQFKLTQTYFSLFNIVMVHSADCVALCTFRI